MQQFFCKISSVLLLLVFSCSYNQVKKNEPPKENQSNTPLSQKKRTEFFHQLIARMNQVELPFNHDMNGPEMSSSSFKFNSSGYDTLFLDKLQSNIIGRLPDTSEFIGILYFFPGDDLLPAVITFDKQGNNIDAKILCSLTCDGAPCEEYVCHSKFVLTKDLQIVNYREIDINRCEGDLENISGISNQKGYIDPNGKIVLRPLEKKNRK